MLRERVGVEARICAYPGTMFTTTHNAVNARVMGCLFAVGRPLSAAIAGLLSLIAVWLHGGFWGRAVAAGGAMWLVTMFGFVINDVLDYAKDAAAGVQRPIATGALGRAAALVYAGLLLVLTAVLARLVGPGSGVPAMTAVALLLYTPAARCAAEMKGMYVAGLCVLPLYYGALITGQHASWGTYVVLLSFVTARETLMDAHEMAGDARAGMRTMAALLGRARARWMSAVVMVLALAALNFTARGVAGRVAAMISVAAIVVVLVWPGVEEGERIALSRIPMLAAAVALASG